MFSALLLTKLEFSSVVRKIRLNRQLSYEKMINRNRPRTVNDIVDAYDLSIIEALSENSGLTSKDLSSKVSLSRTAVVRRVEVLRDRGLIDVPKSTVSFEKLGFTIRAIIHITAPSKGSFKLLDDVLARPEVISVSVVVGNGLMVAEAIFRDTNHMHRFLSWLKDYGNSETYVVLKRHESTMPIRQRLQLTDDFLATPDQRFS